MPFFLIALLLFMMMPDPAHAGPVFLAALSGGAGLGAAFGATALGTFLNTTLGKLLFTVASSALQAALQKKPQPPGIVTESTLTGSSRPLSFILGRYATGGGLQGPLRSHGQVGKTPNAYRTAIVVLGAIPGMKVSRLMVNGEYVELGTTPHADYGLPVLGRFEGYAWMKYYDGTQTAADPMLVAKYGSDPDRPITANSIGTGLCYAILTFRLSQSVFPSGEPSWRFEMDGIPLYDPRKDSTVGGSGAHRWANKATWEPSDNPQVQAYNIKRGIEIPGLGVWGGNIPTEDLPLSNWFAAMNICDQTVTRPGGATEPRYRTGFEVTVDMEPADVLEELNKASATQIAEVGGVWKPRTGGPGLPVYFMTDDDIITSASQEMDPFPGADQRFNGIATSGPNPEAVWENEPDPERYNADWEAEDGGKRRMASLDLRACPYPLQRQRVGRGYISDERRFRRHQHLLPSDAAILEPLDTLAWTSTKFGYSTKHFEVGDMQDDIISIQQSVALREVDPTDYADPPEFGEIILPVPTTRRPIPAQVLAGFNVSGGSTSGADGVPRRPYLELVWDGDEQDGVTGVAWEVRLLAGGIDVSRGTISNVEAGKYRVFDGILRDTWYQARAKQIAPWPVAWTPWVTVQSTSAGMMAEDMASAFLEEIDRIAELAGIKTVSVLPTAGEKPDQVVMLVPPGRLYRWDAVALEWTTTLVAGVEPGSLNIAAFANSIRPIEIVNALPTTGNFAGRTVFLTTDNKLYRHSGSPAGAAGFSASIPAVDITGQLTSAQLAAIEAAKITGQLTNAQIADVAAAKLTGQITAPQIANGAVTDAKIAGLAASKVTGQLTNAQIAEVAAAKLTGQITETQITDSAISTPKLAAGAVEAAKIAAGAVTADKVAANAITAVKIEAGAITTAKIAAGAVTATTIAADAVTADKVAANAIEAGAIAAGAVTAVKISAGAVTTAKLAAGAVVAETIGANEVTTAKIAAGAVTANEIAANAIVADKIAANAITSVKIAANAVTANELAANAVTADKIAANAITAGKIAAGAVSADQISAGAIVASKLAIGDTSNAFPDPLLVDFPNGWVFTTSADYNAGVATVAANSLTFSPSRNEIRMVVAGVESTGGANSPPCSVDAGQHYFVSMCIGARDAAGLTANCTTRLYVRWYSSDDGTGLISSSLVQETTQTYSTSSAPLSGIVQAPADARSARLYAQRVGGATNDAYTFSGPVVRRANAGELTVDGSIRANHLAVETLLTNSAQIGALIVNNTHMANATITTAKIADAQITTAKIANLAVGSAQIAALAVTGAKIAKLTVGTINITDNAVTNGVAFNENTTKYSSMGVRSRDITISCNAGTKVMIWVRGRLSRDDTGILGSSTLVVKWNGTVVSTAPASGNTLVMDDMISVTAIDGTNTLRIEADINTSYRTRFVRGPGAMIELKK